MSSIYTSPFSSATSYFFEITTLGTTTTLNPFKAPPFTSKLTVSLLATSVSTFSFVLSSVKLQFVNSKSLDVYNMSPSFIVLFIISGNSISCTFLLPVATSIVNFAP